MNMNFAKLNEDGSLTYAPDVLAYGGRILISAPAEAYQAAGWLVVKDEPPTASTGFYAAPTGYEVRDGAIYRTYELKESAATPTLISKEKVAAKVDEMGKTAEFFAWLNSKAQYATAWFNGATTVEYDATANGGDLASLIAALGIETAQIPAIIAECVAEAE